MISDEEIKEIQFARPGDELISIREVCLGEKRDFMYNDNYSTFSNNPDLCGLPSSRYRLDGLYGDGFDQASFAWPDEDGSTSIALLDSEPGFAFDREIKQEHAPSSSVKYEKKAWYLEPETVTSTSSDVNHGGREFQHQYTLIRHLPTHTDERNFHCSTCGKSFRQLSTLTQHRAIHSSERPYACELCSKTFNRVSTLISHRKTHSENKPYKCHICPKGFHQKGNLRNHLFTHTNERPYRCNICFKGFNQQSNLVCHKNKAHPGHPVDADKSTLPPEKRNDVRQPISNNEVSSTSAKSAEIKTNIWSAASGLGVVVDPINTYHMGVALARKQTPFALLKPADCSPVLVKIVDAKLPGGKQMLVPATAEDLRVGGKIVVNNECSGPLQQPLGDRNVNGAVQIRVPVVATVIPRFKSGGRLHLAVEEPHHAYHTALSSEVPETLTPKSEKFAPLTVQPEPEPINEQSKTLETTCPVSTHSYGSFDEHAHKISTDPTFLFGSGQFSPTLDLMSQMDLFGAMEGIPMGPQVTAVDHIDQLPHDDDSDIFIGEFEESIPISESD